VFSRFFLSALLLSLAASCAAPALPDSAGLVDVHVLRVNTTNIGVLQNDEGGAMLIDIGLEGAFEEAQVLLEEVGIDVDDIELALLTHAHGDHAGDAPNLQAAGIEVWIHEGDEERLTQGINGDTEVYGLEAAVLEPFVTGPYPATVPDHVVTGAFSRLEAYDADVLLSEGHTEGSVSVVAGGEVAFVGDLIRGGGLGGTLNPTAPCIHYYHVDIDQSHAALDDVLQRYPDVHTFIPAHGGPFTREQVADFLLDQGFCF